ncbi:mediator complex, subunit Med20 [Dipodascopsis uninucleata]
MPCTGILLIHDSSITATTISSVNDRISRVFPKSIGPWSLEYKLYRENPALDSNSGKYKIGQSTGPRFLSQLTLSHHADQVFCLIDDTHGRSKLNNGQAQQQAQLQQNETTGRKVIATFDKGMDLIISSKLQSLWILRKSMRAEGMANSVGTDFEIRVANVTQSGSFKFLIAEITYLKGNSISESKHPIQEFITKCQLPPGKLFFGATLDILDRKNDESMAFTELDTGIQYMEVFRARSI